MQTTLQAEYEPKEGIDVIREARNVIDPVQERKRQQEEEMDEAHLIIFSYHLNKIQYYLTVFFMSHYRDSPSRSYRRSPPRMIGTERQIIEDQIQLKNALRSESENHRLLDQISLLTIKLRKTEELDAKCETLLKQNNLLAHENEQLARELGDRRYEIERYKSSTLQLQERDALKSNQLSEINHSLELEIQLLKKQRLDSNKLYENHIQKLEFMLEDKIKEIDILSVRCNDLINEKEVSEIRFEEQRNQLKNQMARTNHDMQRELQYTKQKNTSQKSVEVETLKRNYTNQTLLLEDEITKLKAANNYKSTQFESQLADNKAIRVKYGQQMEVLEADNACLRQKLLKLEQMNRDEVVNIEVKYKHLQQKDTSELITGHVREIKTLFAEIDKYKWLLEDKNQEIQNLIRDKKQQKLLQEERELAFRAEIDTLKNKMFVEQENLTTQNQQQAARINSLADKLHRDSENYHERVNHFKKNISDLENQIRSKQNQSDALRGQFQLKVKELNKGLEDLEYCLDKTKRELKETLADKATLQQSFDDYKANTQKIMQELTKKNKELQTQKEELQDKLRRATQNSGDAQRILKLEIESLNKNIALLEQSLAEEQTSHSKEMSNLSENLKAKLEKLQATQKKTLTEIEQSRANEVEALSRRIQKLSREKEDAFAKFKEYIAMFEQLNQYFADPHDGEVSRERGDSSIYEVLQKVANSTINIF